MLIVISNPTPVANEAAMINTLFHEGLELFHIRKPDASVADIRQLIDQIQSGYLQKIALHQHHQLANDYGLTRLHFPENKRYQMSEEALGALKKENKILSTSIHQVEEYDRLPACFEYSFFGPVFNSISKNNYASSLKNDFVFPLRFNRPKIIAIGGINATNILELQHKQFKGAAVLGAVWQDPENGLKHFKKIQKAWKETGQ